MELGDGSVPGAEATGLLSWQLARCVDSDPVATAPGTDSAIATAVVPILTNCYTPPFVHSLRLRKSI